MNKQAKVRIQGRVQGVWFRAFTRDQAQAEDVTGWVRNCSDGSVEALFEGDEEKVKKVIEKCRQGPPSAQVDTIDVTWDEPGGDHPAFVIRH